MATKKNSAKSASKSKKKTSASGRKISFEFTLTGLFALGSLFLVIVVWGFVLGILVGRGYQPERFVPHLENVLPSGDRAKADKSGEKVLRSEELGFFEALRSESEEPALQQQKSQAAAPPETRQQRASAPQQSDGGQRYALIYQVAAFQVHDKALKMQKILRKKQMESFLSEANRDGTTWYRVLVPFTGTRAQARELKTRLAEAGVNNPFVYKKKSLQD